MDDNQIREILMEIVDSGSFPGDEVEERHIKMIEEFRFCDNQNIARFVIERHPHLFGRHSFGKSYSPYLIEYHNFEIDLQKKEVKLSEIKRGKPVIDYTQLAVGKVLEFFDLEDYFQSVVKEKLSSFRDIVDVVLFANSDFNDFEIYNKPLLLEIVPSFDFKRFDEELRKEFIRGVINKWEQVKN